MANEQNPSNTNVNYLETRRAALHMALRNLLGNNNVYYQPPESSKINYPCILYELDNIHIRAADNLVYRRKYRFRITVVDTDATSDIADAVSKAFASIKYIRHYNSGELNHFVFTVNY